MNWCMELTIYIVFAGRDPATDLRGVGILSLLQLLYFVTEPKSQQLARTVYLMSLHDRQVRVYHAASASLTYRHPPFCRC